jgi:hypothetical protein
MIATQERLLTAPVSLINVDLAEPATGTATVFVTTSIGRWGLLDRMGPGAGVLKVVLACEGRQGSFKN